MRDLGVKGANDTLLTKVKQAYKIDLKSLEFASDFFANPITHHQGMTVYISEPGLY